VRIEKLVYGGSGLGRWEGKVVFVPFVLPGEEVSYTAVNDRKDLTEARLAAVEAPSPQRIAARCPYFGRCGGCHYQHAGYDYQLEQKRSILSEVLKRIGRFDPPEHIGIVSAEPWGYRNRIQVHLRDGRAGFLEPGSNRLCEVENCPVASPKLNEALAALGRMARDRRFPRFVRTIELFSNETAVQLNVLGTEANRHVARSFFDWASEQIPGLAGSVLEYPAAGETFRVGHRSFFQVNRFFVDDLVTTALGDEMGEHAFDLYAGVGLFSLPLTKRFQHVTAVEAGAGAFNDLEWNASRHGDSIEAVRHSVDLFLEGVTKAPCFVLADPPRAGLGKTVIRQLLRLMPRRLAIVSCDPATLARDLAALLGGGYAIQSVSLVDLFPHTFHIETVVHLLLSGERQGP
jgi:23S rRNA (uracil1939-C5)-methyltransferase